MIGRNLTLFTVVTYMSDFTTISGYPKSYCVYLKNEKNETLS